MNVALKLEEEDDYNGIGLHLIDDATFQLMDDYKGNDAGDDDGDVYYLVED